MTTHHDSQLLGAYVLGALDGPEVRAVREHLAGCPVCRAEEQELRAVEEAMSEVPPELLLDGPPEGGDPVLRRALRQARAERDRRVRRRRFAVGLVAAAVAAVVLGGGFAAGRSTAPADRQAVSTPPAPPAPPATGTRDRVGTAVDPVTGARLTALLQPAPGWVRVNASVAGVAQDEQCRLFVVAKDGTRREAGSWLVSPLGEREGTNLDGSALVAPEDVVAVEVRNFAERHIVTVRF
ncbi:anti-sigma factor family protein [Saccharothrix australiensis]|uniref:Putative zinc finger protein n=1 Tax=Saccharothrix australiensis TaxID=2072 RepID=A0A495W4I1_9PSEU|nr:zf-HC2 domain-containing protein [Saccharothrix australiensis]RKT56562.1 putative zinc finger protein [Saccharothrix australiensis]